MRYSKIKNILPGEPVGDTVTVLLYSFFSKTRKGISIRPTAFIPDIDLYILPYNKTLATPSSAVVLRDAKYVVRYGQDAVDLSTGNNTNFAITTNTGEIVWVFVEEYL